MKRLIYAVAGALFVTAAIAVIRTLGMTAPAGESPAPVDASSAGGKAMAERLGAAIRLQTISWGPDRAPDVAAFEALHAHLEASYPEAHRAMTRESVGLSLIYRWKGTDDAAQPVAFLAHQDVVPVEAGTEAAWTHPPFDGVVSDGKIWGRGAVDDKGSIIALMEAAERLAAAGFKPNRDVYFLLGHDEEVSGADGARRIAALMKARGVRFEWTLDEGSAVVDGVVPGAKAPVALIATAEKGYATLRIEALADGGHSSAPGRDTAVSLVARAIVALADHPYPIKLDDDTVAFLHALAPQLPFARRVALANLWLTGPLVAGSLAESPVVAAAMRTTTAPTMIAGGVKENVLPQRASATVNFRIHPRDTVESVKLRAERLINNPKVKVTVVSGNEPSPRSSRAAPAFLAMTQSTRAMFGGVAVAPSLVIAATDSRNYVGVADAQYRFTPFILEPEDLRRVHGTDERLDVENLVRAAAWYEDFIRRTAG